MQNLTDLVDKAANALPGARTHAEISAAENLAGAVNTMAKSAERLAKAKGAHVKKGFEFRGEAPLSRRFACGEGADLAICRRVRRKPRKAEGDCFGFGAKPAFIAIYIHVVDDRVSESGLAF